MTKPQAIQDAKERSKKTGLTWLVIRIRLRRFVSYIYDTVSEHHITTHKRLYESGHFKIIKVFKPDISKIDLSYLPINRKARRKLIRKLTQK